MGDRGNVVVRGSDGDVWLYTHWNGSEMKDVLQNVLARKVRWNDAPYLTRMIFSAMVKNNIDDEIGFGISTSMRDNEHGILVVDIEKQKIVRVQEQDLVNSRLPAQLDYRVSRTFTEFAANGFKKRLERRIVRKCGRRKKMDSLGLGDRRKYFGRRKGER